VLCVGMNARVRDYQFGTYRAWTNREWNSLEPLNHCSSFRHIPWQQHSWVSSLPIDNTTPSFKIYPSFEVSSGTSGSDEKISSAKIDPLASDQREGVTHDLSSRGVIGTDRSIDQSKIDPLKVTALVLRFFSLSSD